MSRFLGGVCCAVVALWGLVLFAQGGAEGEAADVLAEFEQKNELENAEERIEAALNGQLKAPLDFTELPLNEIINTLAEEYDIPIVFDNAALNEVAVGPDTQISVNLRNISLRSALNLIFSQQGVNDLTYVIENEVLLITTQEQASATQELRLYRVDDFEIVDQREGRGRSTPVAFTPLIDVITSAVNRDSWAENETGDGVVCAVKPGILVVYNTRDTHQKIAELLQDLRRLKGDIDSQSPIGASATSALAE